jgi:N-methylhydantoinase B
MSIDPITVEVIGSYLMTVAEEMGVTLVRTAFSPNIKERGDCSTAVFDRDGHTIAQAPRIPIHLGSMLGLVAEVLARYPLDSLGPGDVFIANDPYTGGGTHLPDITAVAPVLFEGRVEAFVAAIGHHADVGGMVPGSESGVCRTIYQEGIRLPPVRMWKRGELDRELLDVILINTRAPRDRLGDLRAQFASIQVGTRGVAELFAKYGRLVPLAMRELQDYAERRIRAALGALPEGTYRAVDFLDNDGFHDRPIRVEAAATIRDGHLHLDWTGTEPQVASSKNVPLNALCATAYTVVKSLVDPGLPANAGYYRAITVSAPAGCLVNPKPPAAVGTRSIAAGVIGDVIAAALSQAMPGKALAGCGTHHLITPAGTDPRTGEYFVSYETFAGALGARPYRDGMDAVRVHASGSANLPVECLEQGFPFRCLRYELLTDSGGAGKFRGGAGLRRDYVNLGDDVTVALSGERQHTPAPGRAGGEPGVPGAFVLDPGTPAERRLPSSIADLPLAKGQVLSIRTPGAGGFGPPRERDAGAVLRDVVEERVSRASAERTYGVVLREAGAVLEVDREATARTRRDLEEPGSRRSDGSGVSRARRERS